LVARVIESLGIPTVLVSTGRDLTELVRPPRSLFVNYPMGNPFGPPNEPGTQRAILTHALTLPGQVTEPGAIVDLDTLDRSPLWPVDFTDKVTRSLLAM
ncbi:MAG: hypothetical protein O3C27_11705, partial [Actinomycetota bacterium]|nr:hypothetical protein [Actinomycetota bacterium]